MAYNDFGTPSRYDNSVTRIGVTSAELKAGSGSVEKTGKLIDFGTDKVSGIQLKITISGSPLGQAQISGDAPAGTVAGDVFANKVNCSGGTPLPAGKVHFIDLTGLDPAKRYELVLFSTAPAGGEAKPVSFTLWDVSSFENRSAATPDHVTISGQFGSGSGLVAGSRPPGLPGGLWEGKSLSFVEHTYEVELYSQVSLPLNAKSLKRRPSVVTFHSLMPSQHSWM